MPTKYDIPHEIGSTPDADFYGKTEGGQKWLIIHDQRAPFAADAIKELGGQYDPRDKVIRFREDNRTAFDEACAIVKNIPYYELPRAYTRYAQDELRAMRERNDESRPMGIETVLRSPFPDNPDASQKDLRMMAATKGTYDAGMTFINRVKIAPPEQLAEVKRFIESGKLDEAALARQNTTLDALQVAMDEGTVDRPLAQRVLNLVQPIKHERVKALQEHIEDGRLVDRDLAKYGVDAGSLHKLSIQDGYDLSDTAKERATKRERDQVEVLREFGYTDRSLDDDLMKLKSKTARNFIEAKEPLLTDEQRAAFNAARRGDGIAHVRPESGLDTAINAAAPNATIVPFAKTIGAYRLAVSNTAGLAAHVDGQENALHKFTSDQFSKQLRENQPAVGSIVVAEKLSRGGTIVHPSLQTTTAAALVERMAMKSAEKAGVSNIHISAPGDTPPKGKGIIVHMDKASELVGITLEDEKAIAVVPYSALAGPPALFAQAEYSVGSSGTNGKSEGQAPEKKKAVAAGRTR